MVLIEVFLAKCSGFIYHPHSWRGRCNVGIGRKPYYTVSRPYKFWNVWFGKINKSIPCLRFFCNQCFAMRSRWCGCFLIFRAHNFRYSSRKLMAFSAFWTWDIAHVALCFGWLSRRMAWLEVLGVIGPTTLPRLCAKQTMANHCKTQIQ